MNLNESVDFHEIESEKLELTQLQFETSKELVNGARLFFSKRGYGLSIRSSRKDKYVVLGCDKGGYYRDPRNVPLEERKRTTKSRLKNCPFQIQGKLKDVGAWKIEIVEYSHNHEASVDTTGHPVSRRLSKEERKSVGHMSKSGIPPRKIMSSVRDMNPNIPANSRTIYNAKAKIRKENLASHSMIQILLEELGHAGFMYDLLHDQGGHITHLFFSHPMSLKVTQHFSNIFVMDCTYKTNRYKMPLLNIVGVSCFNTSFYSGFAFLKTESEEDYVWALKMFSKLLGGKQPSVIITDKKQALINVIKIVFPNCTHLLCVWHIEKNILTNCKKKFETEEDWKVFLCLWNKVVYSSSEDEYRENWKELEIVYKEKKDVLNYIEKVWVPCKEKFVGAWTDECMHFGNRASSRAESAHAKLKKYLEVSTGDLLEVQTKICLTIQNEFNEIKVRLSSEKIHLLHICNASFFKDVIYRVSLHALKEVYKQYQKAKLGTLSPICTGQYTRTMGLPCAHKMSNWKDGILPLELIHTQWRIDKLTLSASSTIFDENCDDSFGILLKELHAKYQEWSISKKEVAEGKISELLYHSDVYFEPNIQQSKGRPRNLNKKRKAASSTQRNPSSFEIVEASCQYGSSKHIGHVCTMD